MSLQELTFLSETQESDLLGVTRHVTQANHPLFENQILTVKEAAKFLKLSSKTVYKRVHRGEIPHKKIGGEIRFLLPALIDWLKGSS